MDAYYQETIARVQHLLKKNTKWKGDYKKYIEQINSLKTSFDEAYNQFDVPKPFQLYMPLSMVVNESTSRRTFFELRFHGQSVAKIIVYKDNMVALRVKKTNAIYKVLRSAGMEQEAEYLCKLFTGTEAKSEYYWRGAEAKEFRRIYATLEEVLKTNNKIRLKGQPEHEMEDALLANFSQKSSDGKELTYIQPVTMLDGKAFFQMPTPIIASNVIKGIDKLAYSKRNLSGIDILARKGRGSGTKLFVFELKHKHRHPEKAICQAIAYATFLRELLRCDCGQDWWRFFGFGGNIPNALDIKAVIAMPNESGACTAFGGKELSLRDSRDKISLEYFYRANEEKGLQQETSILI